VMTTIVKLPPFPSSQSRKALSPTQLSNLYQTIILSLQTCISLDSQKHDQSSTQTYLSSYFRDAAFNALQSLIWKLESTPSKQERLIQAKSFDLAEKVASSAPSLDLETLLDIAVVYRKKNASRVRSLFKAAFEKSSALLGQLRTDMLPAILQLLASSQSLGLYGIAKTAYCIVCFLKALPNEGVKIFASDSAFFVSIAQIYDTGLSSIATSYGGFPSDLNHIDPDGWELKYTQAKVDLIDSFHVLISRLLEDVAVASGTSLAIACDQAFHVLFTLLDAPSSSQSASQTPFLDRSLLHDYQQSYNLAKELESTINRVSADDARSQALQSSLLALCSSSPEDSGILRLLIQSSGAPPPTPRSHTPKGKQKETSIQENTSAASPSTAEAEVDSMVAQVLDILPEHSPTHIRALLLLPDYPFHRNVEKIIEALLEGTVPEASEVERISSSRSTTVPLRSSERRNIFNEEAFDVSRVHVGKKRYYC
jgi:activating signal cointegrator complex subunit 2